MPLFFCLKLAAHFYRKTFGSRKFHYDHDGDKSREKSPPTNQLSLPHVKYCGLQKIFFFLYFFVLAAFFYFRRQRSPRLTFYSANCPKCANQESTSYLLTDSSLLPPFFLSLLLLLLLSLPRKEPLLTRIYSSAFLQSDLLS